MRKTTNSKGVHNMVKPQAAPKFVSKWEDRAKARKIKPQHHEEDTGHKEGF